MDYTRRTTTKWNGICIGRGGEQGRKLHPLCQAHAERAYTSSTFTSPRIAPQGENLYAKLTSNGILKSMPSLVVQVALPIVVGAFSIFVIRITNDLVDFYV
jgi:hypothetical protein